tara:strand:- start:3 stop:206 length:204 start_codon:yes stop_codon:yes gene_type:complete
MNESHSLTISSTDFSDQISILSPTKPSKNLLAFVALPFAQEAFWLDLLEERKFLICSERLRYTHMDL